MTVTEVPSTTEQAASGGDDPLQQSRKPGVEQELTAALVRERWEKGSKAIQKERRDYWINLAFLLDEQWIWWDKRRQSIADLPRDPNRVRLVINRMRPNLVTLVAKLMKRELAFEVQPTSADDATSRGAKLGEQVLEGVRVDQKLELLRHEVLMGTFLGGTFGVGVDWDPRSGQQLDEDPETGEITGTGEIVLSGANVCELALPAGLRDYQSADWWIRAVAMPPEEARAKYDLDFTPKADASGQYSPFQQRFMSDTGKPQQSELCMVISYYERPNTQRKQGAAGTVIGDRFVDGPFPWPFPFTDKLNLVIFHQLHVPGRWTGDTLFTSARTVQVAYNQQCSILAEHSKLAGNARLMVPDAALDIIDALTDTPGEVVPFNNQAGQPYYLAPPNLPRWVQQLADMYSAQLDDIMCVHDVSRGQAGQDSSGVALSVLAEKDDTPMGLMAFDQSQGWGALGTMVLELYADKATEPRTTTLPGNRVPRPVEWSGDKLMGQTRVRVPLDNVMPHSRVAQQAWATQLWDRQIITDPVRFAQIADLPDQEDLTAALDPDIDKAEWENEMMEQDIVILPADFDDHGKHIAEHNAMRKSTTYYFADPQVQKLFDMHVQAHEVLEAEQLAQQMNRAAAMGPEGAAMPQQGEPPGSQVPDTHDERVAQAKGSGPAAPAGGPGPAQPSGLMGMPGAPGAAPPGAAKSPATAKPFPKVNQAPGETSRVK